MTQHKNQFVVCIDNEGHPASLEVRKLYQALPDPMTEKTGHIRVIDESGEDYLYPENRFVMVDLPEDIELQLLQLTKGKDWPEGYFEQLGAWEGEDLVRPEQGEYEVRLEFSDKAFSDEATPIHFDISPVANTDISHIDKAAVDDYYRSYYNTAFIDLPDDEQLNLLINTDILVKHEGEWVASVGGLLIFGKKPQRRLPQSSIMFAVFKGISITDDLADKKEITGTLPGLIDKTLGLLQLYLPVPSTIEGAKRKEALPAPPKVLREAIVNAVMHRDYSISRRKIQVYIYSDRVEITSPGSLPNTLTLEKIRYGNSAPRNVFLVKFLDNLRYFDGLGRGVPMMVETMQDRIAFENIGELFRLTLYLDNQHGH